MSDEALASFPASPAPRRPPRARAAPRPPASRTRRRAWPFWHPRGWTLYRLLEELVRAHVRAAGYREVRTPQVVRRPIWERSGHWEQLPRLDVRVRRGRERGRAEAGELPGPHPARAKMAPSWRDLPLRIAELGLVHRDEASGTLHGLLRLRQFCQDDGHIFCAPDDVAAEAERFARELLGFYRRFGFEDLAFALSLRPPPEGRLGDDAVWDRAERVLADVMDRLGVPCEVQPGAGAIYGPKIELSCAIAAGGRWQCGTLRDRLRDARAVRPALRRRGRRAAASRSCTARCSARSSASSAILLEHHGAELPAWLRARAGRCDPGGRRARGRRGGRLPRLARRGAARAPRRRRRDPGPRVRRAHRDGVPFVVVLGDREVGAGSLAARAGRRVERPGGRGHRRALAAVRPAAGAAGRGDGARRAESGVPSRAVAAIRACAPVA